MKFASGECMHGTKGWYNGLNYEVGQLKAETLIY